MTTKTQAGLQTAPAPWPTITTAELLAHPGNVRDVEPPADLLAAVKANGVQEPLYIVSTHGGVPQIIDGFQRLAAAVDAGLEILPFTPRPVIRIDALTPHPENAREDLDINARFVESFRIEGCRIPIKIQRLEGGIIQVNDGHRRYFGSKDAGLTHLPYEWDDDDRDAAGQFVDMITTSEQRKSLTGKEMNQAMFSAAEAGANVGRIAKAAGVRQKDVKAVVRVHSSEKLSAAVGKTGGRYEWTFDHMAALAEFADDDAEFAAITEAATGRWADDNDVEWAIAKARTRREKRERAAAHRAELEADGHKVRDIEELSDRATPVRKLPGVTQEGHATCKGQVWVLDTDSADRYEPYCVSPVLYEHVTPEAAQTGAKAATAEAEAGRAALAATKAGNIHWDAAEEVRRKWIADLVKARTLPKATVNALIQHVNEALLNGTWDLSSDLNKGPTSEILAAFLGLNATQAKERSSFADHVAKDPRKAPQLQFAVIAAVREKNATRVAWRTDSQRCADIRKPTAKWFRVLGALGCPLTPIERAVVNDEPYDPAAKEPTASLLGGGEPEADPDAEQAEENPESEPEAEAPAEAEGDQADAEPEGAEPEPEAEPDAPAAEKPTAETEAA
ncbi:ParB N-terminal domain-containing protein [Kitasatospora sp. NPDC059817]|uniref:ParB N-terminal domain-containing protein n=1 Tax=Kitasatospora sp. NPDC059817 TaxID=3346961 RepID=UPI00365DC365